MAQQCHQLDWRINLYCGQHGQSDVPDLKSISFLRQATELKKKPKTYLQRRDRFGMFDVYSLESPCVFGYYLFQELLRAMQHFQSLRNSSTWHMYNQHSAIPMYFYNTYAYSHNGPDASLWNRKFRNHRRKSETNNSVDFFLIECIKHYFGVNLNLLFRISMSLALLIHMKNYSFDRVTL